MAVQAWERDLGFSELPSKTRMTENYDTIFSEDEAIDKRERKLYQKKVMNHNRNLHSLSCDLRIKLGIASKLQDEQFYFPFNLDFRGRAYPVPQNLTTVGSDLCRSLLKFATPKPLGSRGYFWMKVHLANLMGNNKISLRDRCEYIEDLIPEVKPTDFHPKRRSFIKC